MGQLSFLIPRPEQASAAAIERAYFAGMEGVPWRSRNQRTDYGFTLDRATNESGSLYIPWNVPNYGQRVLGTASLMERSRPYVLPLELARGTLNRLRNQLATWQQSGLATPDALVALIRQATDHLARAATDQSSLEAVTDQSNEAIAVGLRAIDALAAEYTEQALAFRHRSTAKLTTLFGAPLGPKRLAAAHANLFCEAFNTAAVTLNWRAVELNAGELNWNEFDEQIQWCRGRELKICCGPLLAFNRLSAPDWLYLWEDDFEGLLQYAMDFVTSAVQRYRGRVHLWNCAAALNVETSLKLTEEQKLRLAVDALEAVRRHDPRTPAIVSFDQPWGEYMAQQSFELSPMHFADALVRADLGLTGLGLNLNLGYSPGGSLPRDPLEISLLVDRWSLLGLPLLVQLAYPAGATSPPNSRVRPLAEAEPNGPSDASQRRHAEEVIQLLLSKPSVQGIFWTQLTDAEPHHFPHAGLLNAQGEPRPVLQSCAAIRREHLL